MHLAAVKHSKTKNIAYMFVCSIVKTSQLCYAQNKEKIHPLKGVGET